MKKLKVVLILFWLSILVMILISKASPNSLSQENTVRQDTIKKEVKTKQMSDLDRKKKEYLEYQQRSRQIEKSMKMLDKQSMVMDSLLGKKDTTKIKK